MANPYNHQWRPIRRMVLERDHWLCSLKLPGCAGIADTVDHIVPLSEGGARLDVSNLRAACKHCNDSRNATRNRDLTAALVGGHRGPSRTW